VEHAFGCVRPCRCKGIVAPRGQQPLAVAIDENARDRTGGSRKAHGAGGADTRMRKTLEHTRAMLVIAERTGKSRLTAQPRDRDRGIGGATAAGDQKFKHRDLVGGRGKALDPKDEVEDRNARAQHDRLVHPFAPWQCQFHAPLLVRPRDFAQTLLTQWC
jgi:hypothetical protein